MSFSKTLNPLGIFSLVQKQHRSSMSSIAIITPRRSSDRGYANHGWLDTHHTFSFASYYDPIHNGFGPLRVLNEDIVQPNQGFPTHPHREYDIFSYIISGELTHTDSMGNVEILKRGDIQHTSTGTGIRHSEWNKHPRLPVHFLQCWVKPDQHGLSPTYMTVHCSDEEKKNTLVPIVVHHSRIAEQEQKLGHVVPTHGRVQVYATLLDKNNSVGLDVSGDGMNAQFYVHVVQSGGPVLLTLSKQDQRVQDRLEPGDGAYITDVAKGSRLELTGQDGLPAEVLLFAMDASY